MKNFNFNCKRVFSKRAFTLIELLIVIAIIGILFIVLVSKVDFATDKAKATGVQTDFRSFQVAFDTVAKENAGFNTFGFDTGDNGGSVAAGGSITINGKAYTYTNADKDKGDGIRNSYDEGDTNLDGKNVGETWTGRKVYTETWSDVWTLVKPGTSGYDADAIFALESAINKNLDPKLHITIAADGKITMANQARDPWKNEYHGYYITNAENDKGDRGAIVMYSNGANGKWGSAHIIENGIVTVGVPGNNKDGKDDYSLVSCYTFANGYGEILNATTGFSNNQSFQGAGLTQTPSVVPGGNSNNSGGAEIGGNSGQTQSPISTYEMLDKPTETITLANPLTFKSSADKSKFVEVKIDGVTVPRGRYSIRSGSTIISLYGDYVNTLSDGSHEIEIVSTDGSAKANFNVALSCRSHEDYYYNEYSDEYYEGDDGYCDNCGIVWCFWYDCIDDHRNCNCDWCGSEAFFHYDANGDSYCDNSYHVYCQDTFECLDLDKNCSCDWCESMMHHFIDDVCNNCHISYCTLNGHSDNNYDGTCDTCQEHYYCVDDNEDNSCDTCHEPMPLWFAVCGRIFYGLPGMTWNEWINSDYNNGDVYLFDLYDVGENVICYANKEVVDRDDCPVSLWSEIEAGYWYEIF